MTLLTKQRTFGDLELLENWKVIAYLNGVEIFNEQEWLWDTSSLHKLHVEHEIKVHGMLCTLLSYMSLNVNRHLIFLLRNHYVFLTELLISTYCIFCNGCYLWNRKMRNITQVYYTKLASPHTCLAMSIKYTISTIKCIEDLKEIWHPCMQYDQNWKYFRIIL